MKLIFVLLSVLISSAWGQSACPLTGWCQTYNGHGWQPGDFGWNRLIFNPDIGRMMLYAIDQGGQTPFESALLTYQHQTVQNTTINPWKVQNSTGAGVLAKTVCQGGGCITPIVNNQGNNAPNKDAKRILGNGTTAGPIS